MECSMNYKITMGFLQGNFIWVKDVTVSYVSGSVQQTFGEKETSSFFIKNEEPTLSQLPVRQSFLPDNPLYALFG